MYAITKIGGPDDGVIATGLRPYFCLRNDKGHTYYTNPNNEYIKEGNKITLYYKGIMTEEEYNELINYESE